MFVGLLPPLFSDVFYVGVNGTAALKCFFRSCKGLF